MRKLRGFTLVEILVVLIIFSIIIAMAAAVTRGISASQKRSITVTRMSGVDAALMQFVAVSKRMPCPANGTLVSTDANAGLEVAPDAVNGCNAQTGGVVPWRTLGMSEQDATDGWERRLTYRTDPLLGLPSHMDMSWCDPAGTGGVTAAGICNTACVSTTLANCTTPQSFLLNKGLQVRNVANTVIMDPAAATPTGAAYVLVSPGETGGGGYLSSGNLGVSSTTDGTQEQKNYANLASQPYYVDDTISDGAGATHFDDLVSRPSVYTLISKAALGPRSH